MAVSLQSWGCCSNELIEEFEQFINCTYCKKSYHFLCLSMPEIARDSEAYDKWKCPECINLAPKTSKKDCTPTRNITTTRGNKRPALNSPPKASPVTSENVRTIVQDVIKKEFNDMLKQLNNSMIGVITKELEPIKNEMRDLKESMSFINKKFEEIESEQLAAKKSFKVLQDINTHLGNTVSDLVQRLNYLEQQSRSNNLELQCLPENKHENLYSTVKQLGIIIGCELKDEDILHCTRIAKMSSSNTRPRSIVIQLASPKVRDQILAAVISFNKSNPQNKLNSEHFGHTGIKKPVYVVEHLSPSNKALHAAARLKSKEKGYKYVWVRKGKIFVRKSENSEYIYIRNSDTLSKIV
ncbi:unnamed protein product [Parnassius mnemosyne]|uniref:PHD-type domain-containing protein n=1 Tax=Parnassius mnemosyne TaxID=213953 RepID=A0AAV1KTM6_9NEOP